MRGLAPPFGREPGGAAALWPVAERRAVPPGRAPQPADPWLDPLERFAGAVALEDLDSAGNPRDAARVLIRYLVVRLAQAGRSRTSGFRPDLERDAARSFLDALPQDDPDRAALEPFVTTSWIRLLQDDLPRRLATAVETGMRHDLRRSTFALLHAGYGAARAAGRFRDAARIARLLAGFATAAGARRAARRWALRAKTAERRSAAPESAG